VSVGRTRRPRLVAALVAAVTLACAAAAAAAPNQGATTPASGAPCGASTAATVSAVVASVESNIYGGELASPETTADARHIARSAALLQAVAQGDKQAARRAVRALVYHPFWHIVRIRVLSLGGHVLADVGGPYVIAPVRGTLRLAGGVIGTYVMSVQDDYGFTVLESHAAGYPIAVYYNGRNVADRGGPLPATQPIGPSLTLGGIDYSVLALTYNAFPRGTLTAVTLVPPPPASLTALPCMVARATEVGHIAKLLTNRFHPLDTSYAYYVTVVHDDTGAIVILRIGTRTLPASDALGPPVIPTSGPVTYLGRNYYVVSFAPTPPARIYVLVSVPPPTGAAG
jgi:hypothetical protein